MSDSKSDQPGGLEDADQGWEMLFGGRFAKLRDLLQNRDIECFQAVPAWLDLTLFSAEKPLDPVLEPCMDTRQLVLQRILQGREAEAVRLMPNAYTHLMLGIASYINAYTVCGGEMDENR